jgi:hypothetical protein
MLLRIRTRINNYPNAVFLLGSCLIAAMVISIWIINCWEYLPDWAPVPGPTVMTLISLFRPIFLFVCGIPTAIAFLGSLVINIETLGDRILNKNLLGIISLILGLAILVSSTFPLFYKDEIEDYLKHYAISRYDVVIDAIENYHTNNGHYPPSLNALVPAYLPAIPGMYMKFGEHLDYFPDPSQGGYVGHGPFIFELTGMYAGIHGQTLKYCPINYESCKSFKSRMDDRWVFAYSTIL